MGRSMIAEMERLHRLILEEREAATSLDMRRLGAVVEEKEALVRSLGAAEIDEDDEELMELAEAIREDNRRNAYLFWSGLNLVRDTMEFFGRHAPPPVYDAGGIAIQTAPGARLLSGRI